MFLLYSHVRCCRHFFFFLRLRTNTYPPSMPDLLIWLNKPLVLIPRNSTPTYIHYTNAHTPSRTHIVQLLISLAKAANLKSKIDAMFSGEHINVTEDRAVLHVATRARRDQVGYCMFCTSMPGVPDGQKRGPSWYAVCACGDQRGFICVFMLVCGQE